MRLSLFSGAISLAALLAASVGAQTPAERQLPLQRVILSSAGLAHFEHEGEVDGDAVLTLPVRLDQVDNLLKSLVVFDSRGTVGGVTLAGREPLEQAFRDLPFSRDDLESPTRLLAALKGAEIVVRAGAGNAQISGRLVSVLPETVQLPNGQGTLERNRITVLTAQGLRAVVLEELESLQFLDEKVQAQLRQALDAVHANSARDRRSLTIMLYGKDRRTVGYAYVVGAPVWKASYRIVLPAQTAPAPGAPAAAPTALLQGWAVVENMTGNDWNDVRLTLVSGNPATYRQQLYNAYYVSRPELPVQVVGRILPRPDTGVIGTAADLQQAAEARAERAAEAAEAMSRQRAARAAPPAAMAMSAAPPPPAPMPIAAPAAAAAAEQASTQVLFRLPDSIFLAAGQSLTMPFLARDMPVDRLWVYQPDTNARHPLAAVRLRNDGTSGLPPGILTLFERSAETGGTNFVGDALLPLLPRGEDRLISFALDNKTQIDREERGDRRTTSATIASGVLRLNVTQRSETVYTVKGPADEARTVLIEQPRRAEWTLVSPDPKDSKSRAELTATHYRVRVPVEAGKTERVAVVLERPGAEVIELRRLSEADLRARAESMGPLNPKVRAAFEEMAGMRREIETIENGLREIEKRREGITRDQARIRDNLKSVPLNSDLAKRYLENLGGQENALDELNAEQRKFQEAQRRAQARLEEYISKLQA